MTLQRKLLGSGYSCLVCIPKYWLEAENLTRGDKVEIEMKLSGELIIKAGKRRIPDATTTKTT